MASANPRVILPSATHKRLEGYPADGRWLDTLSVITSTLFLLGLFLDGWAHNSIPKLESFFTPWHAVLYSGFFSVAILMGVTQYRNVGKGYAWSKAMPRGYGLSLLGIVIFFIGGAGVVPVIRGDSRLTDHIPFGSSLSAYLTRSSLRSLSTVHLR